MLAFWSGPGPINQKADTGIPSLLRRFLFPLVDDDRTPPPRKHLAIFVGSIIAFHLLPLNRTSVCMRRKVCALSKAQQRCCFREGFDIVQMKLEGEET